MSDYLWWLSFVDTARAAPPGHGVPGGPAFQGVAIVAADTAPGAVFEAHRLGCNPGGEVAIYGPFPPRSIPPEWLNRLLTAQEADQVPEPSQPPERSAQ